jgi:hypothetical protein
MSDRRRGEGRPRVDIVKIERLGAWGESATLCAMVTVTMITLTSRGDY